MKIIDDKTGLEIQNPDLTQGRLRSETEAVEHPAQEGVPEHPAVYPLHRRRAGGPQGSRTGRAAAHYGRASRGAGSRHARSFGCTGGVTTYGQVLCNTDPAAPVRRRIYH